MATLIQQIDGRSVHQIQSGQVINDGLTSAVKELVENSLDAGATSIEVRFKNYGLECIDVNDNGEGVSKDNYESICLKHYTSKLRDYSDLETVSTFGFRGEALSSLCALSSLQITTATAAEVPKGVRLNFETSGKLKSQSIIAASKGTTVSVGTLFKSLPVRRRELERNVKREYAKVLGILQAYAGICIGVKFSVFNQPAKGKRAPVFATKGNPTTRENISNVFGSKTLIALVPLDLMFEMKPPPKSILNKNLDRDDNEKNREVKVVGHISRPVVGEGRNAPDRQMFFVNGRPCSLPQIAKAFNEVYKGFNVTQSPFIFADLRLDTHAYDVNVSPDKRTILLHDQPELLENLKNSLGDLFGKHEQTVPVNQLGATPKFSAHKQIGLAQGFSSPFRRSSTPALSSPISTLRLDRVIDIDSNEDDCDVPSSPPSQPLGTDVDEEDDTLPRLAQRNPVDKNSPRYNITSGSSRLPFKPPSKVTQKPQESSPLFTTTTTADLLDQGSEVDILSSPVPQTSQPSKLRTMSYRSPRKTNAPATITIGDRSPVLSGLLPVSPPPKRRKVDIDTTGKSKVGEVVDFMSALNKFRASQIKSSEVIDIDENTEDDAEEETHTDDSDTEMNMDGGALERLQSIDKEDIPILDSTPLFLPGPTLDESEEEIEPREAEKEITPSQSSAALKVVIGNDKDEEFAPEPELQLRAKIRAARMLKDAEDLEVYTNGPSDHLLERASRILKGSRKRTTKPYIQNFDVSLKEVEELSQRLSKASLESIAAHSEAEDLLNSGDDAAEERLTLTVTKEDFMKMEIKGQFNKGFIITTRGSELFIIDQHASDEKYNFETLQATTIVQNQPLVAPRELELMAMDEIAVTEHLDILKKNGFIVSVDSDKPTGKRCKLVSLPMSKETVFGIEDLEELIHLIHQTPGPGEHIRCSKVRSMFAMRACRRSVMVGKALPQKAMEKIVRHMGTLDKPWNCPHGRPTMRHLADLQSIRTWNEYDDYNGGSCQWEGESWRVIIEDFATGDIQEQEEEEEEEA